MQLKFNKHCLESKNVFMTTERLVVSYLEELVVGGVILDMDFTELLKLIELKQHYKHAGWRAGISTG